jgi:hypothetical protein
MTPMSLPNVKISQKLLDKDKDPAQSNLCNFSNTQLSEFVWLVASQYPLWELRIAELFSPHGREVRRIYVYQGKELIGEIGSEYSSRSGGSVVYIKNDRITANRSRNGGKMISNNNKKLLSAIKKNFGCKTINEKLDEAAFSASTNITSAAWEHAMTSNRLKTKLADDVVDYVLGAGRESYVQHLTTSGNLNSIASLDEFMEAQKMSSASAQIKDMFGKQQLTLILLDNDKYLVKDSTVTNVFDADSLPQNLRRSLGMLKLVEKGQIISNSGMRVEENIFIVVQDPIE